MKTGSGLAVTACPVQISRRWLRYTESQPRDKHGALHGCGKVSGSHTLSQVEDTGGEGVGIHHVDRGSSLGDVGQLVGGNQEIVGHVFGIGHVVVAGGAVNRGFHIAADDGEAGFHLAPDGFQNFQSAGGDIYGIGVVFIVVLVIIGFGAGGHGQNHGDSQDQGEELLHLVFPPVK